ncbi:MAG TPA: nuclear transport factor 2 family protein [Bryobacteraceae bacterium]|nr:nuclear transport factor 2 family protein [Bryobacteraceae bacterium]
MIKFLGLMALLAVAVNAQDANVEAVRKSARELERALIAADSSALEKLLTGDFIRTPPGGGDTNKSQYIELVSSGRLKYVAFQNLEEKFRAYTNTVLLNQVSDLRYRSGEGPERVMRLKLIWVWVKQDGQWRVAAVQGNQVPRQ